MGLTGSITDASGCHEQIQLISMQVPTLKHFDPSPWVRPGLLRLRSLVFQNGWSYRGEVRNSERDGGFGSEDVHRHPPLGLHS